MTKDQLLQTAKQYIKENSIADLAEKTDRSRTQLSLWIHGKYTHDDTKIVDALRSFFRSQGTSTKDERIYQRITELLQNAENPENIIAALTLRGRGV